MYRLAVFAILVAGCRIGARPDSAPGDASGPTGNGAAPANFSDLAPGDTAAVIAMMRQIMHSVDAGLGEMTQRDTTIAPGADSTSHHYTIWLQDGVPRKLVVIDSTGHGQNNTETDAWFMGGDLAVLLQVSDAYAFDSDRIVLWTDEALQPRADATADALMAKQGALAEAVRGWLALVGIKAP